MDNFFRLVGMVIGIIFTVIFLSFILAFPVKWCWNYVMPYLFELKEIGVGQAWCLSFLASTFFKSSSINNKN
jgi:ABC-type polysaccharide/polyol phosphate export permease